MRIINQIGNHKRIIRQLVIFQVRCELRERNDIVTLAGTVDFFDHQDQARRRTFWLVLIYVMVVAIISAKWADVDSLETFLGFDEVAYFVMFAWLAIAGPGSVSVDHFILKAFRPDRPPSHYGA